MKKRVTTVKEESTICPMDETVKQTLLEALDREIAKLQKAKEALVTDNLLTIAVATPAAVPVIHKGHVSEEAKQRLSQRMKLVWAVRNATQKGNRAAIKEAKEALEQWDKDNPKK